MRNMTKFKKVYLFIFLLCVFVLSASTTYAYWVAKASSGEKSVKAESTIYSINMNISPLYTDFSFIPMNDDDALKALKNKCKDKFGRGACSAYKINVFGYSSSLAFVSGYMDVFTNNMVNLSYMVYRESDTYDENSCVVVDDKNYCVVLGASPINDGVGLTLGDKYDVYGMESTEFILMFWLTNLDFSQNASDIGEFSAAVTMQAGNGGEIKGSISSVVIVEKPDEDNNSDIIPDDGGNNESSGDGGNTEEGDNGVEGGMEG